MKILVACEESQAGIVLLEADTYTYFSTFKYINLYIKIYFFHRNMYHPYAFFLLNPNFSSSFKSTLSFYAKCHI